MITFKQLSMRNFLSYGNNITTIKLSFDKPTLVVGRNYDAIVDGQLDSNGAGKSTILNAIAFCLYDKMISKIDKSNVVNYINDKNMEISIIFEKDGVHYKIERYRKNKAKGGDGVRIFINPDCATFDITHDKTPDSIANADAEIARIMGIPFEIFSRIVVFTASYQPFLSLPSSHASQANQRDIIEELFGLTELTRKAEKLKLLITDTKKNLKAQSESNDRIDAERARYNTQLNSTLKKQEEWDATREEELLTIKQKLKAYNKIDIDTIESTLSNISNLVSERESLINEISLLQHSLDSATKNNNSILKWDLDKQSTMDDISGKIKHLMVYDVKMLTETAVKVEQLTRRLFDLNSSINSTKKLHNRVTEDSKQKTNEINELSDNKCPYCKQDFHNTITTLDECKTSLQALMEQERLYSVELSKLDGEKNDIVSELTPLTEIDIPPNLKAIESNLVKLQTELDVISLTENPFKLIDTTQFIANIKQKNQLLDTIDNNITTQRDILKAIDGSMIGVSQWVSSTVAKIAIDIDRLLAKLDSLKDSVNPYQSIVDEITQTLENDIEVADTDSVDRMYVELEHQEFLLKLLTKKDSFVRKALLNKNIPFLNSRLSHYLSVIGLSHKVLFTEEMGAKITQFGTEYNFENLSTGQRARVNIALSFAFRDVLQARFSKINFCILDELLDVGLSNVGIQLTAKMIKNVAVSDKLSMLIISHRDEISSMFDSKLEVELRGGFSNIVKSELLIESDVVVDE